MSVLSIGGVVLFMLTSLVVGLRLLALWWSTRRLPELLMAIALLCVGFLSYAVGTAGKLLVAGTLEQRSLFTSIGLCIECAGHFALIAFSWRVFHKRDIWAGALAGVLCALIAVAFSGEVMSGEYLRYSDSQLISGLYVPIGLAVRGAAPAWMAIECFRLHGKFRLRLQIGLAEPMVVNRVALWGVGLGSSALGFALSVVHRLVFGTGLRVHVWALSTVSVLATITAVSIGIAFFPPQAYRRWIENRTAPIPPA
jgi:hypothetical protein